MKTTRLFLIISALTSSVVYSEDSRPYDKGFETDYESYKEYEWPLPKVYLDRKSRPAAWVYKTYGVPLLPSNPPRSYDFLGDTTSAASFGEKFVLKRVIFSRPITQPTKYVFDSKGNKKRFVNVTVDLRLFPKTKKPPVVYDAFMVVGELEDPNDLLGIANPAFPTPKLDSDIVNLLAPRLWNAKTEYEKELYRGQVHQYLKNQNKNSKTQVTRNLNILAGFFKRR